MDRRQFKKSAHQTVKKHYLILVAVCLAAALFGAEFTSPFSASTSGGTSVGEETTEAQPAEETTVQDYSNVIIELIQGKTQEAQQSADKITNSSAFGISGPAAKIINTVSSGSILIQIYVFVNSISHSASIASFAALFIAALLYLVIWLFIFQVLNVLIRRIALEARTYDHVPLQDVLYPKAVKRWMKTCLANAKRLLYEAFWAMTIVGYFIKHYSYLCAPYILAENPDLNGTQSLDLSRKMMDGHKFEAFRLDLTMIGWYLLNAFTLGLAGIFYVNPYRTAVFTEYYAELRKEAKEKQIEGSEYLNDTYLYEKADTESLTKTYRSTKMDEMYIQDTEVKLTGAKKFFAEDLSIWVGNAKDKKIYQGVENLKYQTKNDRGALDGKQYPSRLSPLYTKDNIHFHGNMNVGRTYTLSSIVLLFIIASVCGWLTTCGARMIQTSSFANSGFLTGPWMPLFGITAILSLTLFAKLRSHPIITTIASILLFGLLQFALSYKLEALYGMRWWDYTGYLFNIGGRTCLASASLYGILNTVFIYMLAPVIDQWLSRSNQTAVRIIAIVLLVLFIIDTVHACMNPSVGAGISEVTSILTQSLL